jgi:hypothetical protein
VETLTARTVAEWSLRAGWRLHHDASDVVRTALRGDSALGRRTMRLLLATIEESAAGVAMFAPDESMRSAWTEVHNKVEAFRAFEHADALVGAPAGAHTITELLQRAGALPPPLSVWAAEGIGYHTTALLCRRQLRDRAPWMQRGMTPEWTQIPLHAGMGSALAVEVLEGAGTKPTQDGIASVLGRFEDLCRAMSAEGWHEVALEAFGFALQGMFGELSAQVNRCVRTARPTLAGLVSHGIGRAVYFAPSAALPLADTRRRVLDDVVAGAGEPRDLANTIAGFAWAATLVNLRNPAVVEPYAEDAVRLGVEREFARGVHDALAAWRSCAPGDPNAAQFLSHLPHNAGTRNHWRRLLEAATARDGSHPARLFQISSGRT